MGGKWIWDGEWLSSGNSHVSFALVDRKDMDVVKIRPKEGVAVKVTSDLQVSNDTIFLD